MNSKINNIIKKYVDNSEEIYLYNNFVYTKIDFEWEKITGIKLMDYYYPKYFMIFNNSKNIFVVHDRMGINLIGGRLIYMNNLLDLPFYLGRLNDLSTIPDKWEITFHVSCHNNKEIIDGVKYFLHHISPHEVNDMIEVK